MLNKQLQKFLFSTKTSYIVAGKRTPIGSHLGKASSKKGPELSSISIKGALDSINLSANEIDEVILGNVCSAGQGQNGARQASLGAGLSVDVPVTNVNKLCASGIKSIVFGAQSIMLGDSHCVVVGGYESMSNVPFYVMNHRKGHGFGNQLLLDGLAYDALTDAYNNIAMGLCSEKSNQELGITRQLQDDYAISSYERTLNSMKTGKFDFEITPFEISAKDGMFTEDEEPLKFKKDKMALLKPAFSKTGTITAANASKINDGACSLILMSEEKMKKLNVKPLARIVSYADAEVDPIDFQICPTKSTQKVLDKAGMKIQHIDFFELNEAFASTALANMKLLDLSHDKVNVNGGAVALGHPVGASGARIVLALINVLRANKGKYGIAGICNGGGGSTSIIIENLS